MDQLLGGRSLKGTLVSNRGLIHVTDHSEAMMGCVGVDDNKTGDLIAAI